MHLTNNWCYTKIYINTNLKKWNKDAVSLFSNVIKYALIPQLYVHGTQML